MDTVNADSAYPLRAPSTVHAPDVERAEMHGVGPSSGHAAMEAGCPWPLGAHADAEGINFAVFSAHAEAIELCVFGHDETPSDRETRIAFPSRTGDVWHGYLRGAAPGLIYGFRAHGPWQPDMGHKFNPRKLLLDPYAREIVGCFEWRDEQFGHNPAEGPLGPMSETDNAQFALKARVVADDSPVASHRAGAFDWGDDKPMYRPMSETVLYEVHVKGFTKRLPDIPEHLRGTYAGLASEAAVAHLKRLGITAVSLLPVHQHLDEQRLVNMGLRNYWGYNTVGFFVPEPSYAASGVTGARDEFKAMVKRLHQAGIEVILDVVFNHSAETDEFGPTISWRGLDNATYYRLPPTPNQAYYENQTGCGNTFDIREPRVLQMVLDSLRFWVRHMHVDGFRFDLAPVLGRSGPNGAFDALGTFFQTVAQDPTLQGVKMIAEPWDIGADGYHVGQFPAGWMEWNDRYRDTLRGFWLGSRGDEQGPNARSLGHLAQRLCASDDMFDRSVRQASESVNFIVAHDGFTLHDLVSYNDKHNEANGEQNRDGHGHNLSWNCGAEGPTDDPSVTELRRQLKRALLALLMLGQGTPMMAAGDELGHTQGGNNNPYCQDNETTWIDWQRADFALADYTAALVHMRLALMPLGIEWNDHLDWVRPDGQPLTADDWNDGSRRALGCLVARPERAGRPLLLLINAGSQATDFRLDTLLTGTEQWHALLDSSAGFVAEGHASIPEGLVGAATRGTRAAPPPPRGASLGAYVLAGRCVALLAAWPAPEN